MAKKAGRKQTDDSVMEAAAAARKLTRCGDCSETYDFCRKTHDGKPILCRCRRRRDFFFRLCSTPGCEEFAKSATPFTGDIPYGFVGTDVFDNSGKVVPLFRKGSEEPCRIILSKDIPKGGITPQMYD